MIEYRKHEQHGDNVGTAIKHTTIYYLRRLVFGGYLITALLLLLQIAMLMTVLFWLNNYANLYYEGSFLLGIICTIFIMNGQSNPAYKTSWIIIIMAFPVAGTLIYLYMKYNFGTLATKKVTSDIGRETKRFAMTDERVIHDIREEHSDLEKMAFYLDKKGNAATYENSSMEYFPLGDDALEPILTELEAAKKFIFMEFFMVEEGVFFDRILEVLERKAKEGVEVRFMYDGFGCAALLPRNYTEVLEKKGIQARCFSKIYPFLSTHYNNRDHRKIIVVDGRCAFTGGINLCDEYINAIEKYGHWKDNVVMVKGEAVKGFTLLFMQTWNSVAYKHGIDYESYLTTYPVEEKGYVIPYGDGPYQDESVAENVYLDILANATEYVYIMTPYLILDHEMENAIAHAAKSGIDVRIILPHIPDKKIAFYIARTYYRKLLAAGVEIYEYKPGFIHSKTFLSDDKIATVGTVNLDFRSLYLHYDCGCVLYKKDGIADIRQDFKETFEKCIAVDKNYYETIPLWQRAAGRLLRIFGPIL